jgi:hypothetical protein
MSVPDPGFEVEPSERLLSLRQKRHEQRMRLTRSARFRALGWEMTSRLTVNLGLTLLALSTLVRLIPYYQTQRQVLREVEQSVETAQTQNQRLRSEFSRYFDPAQTSQVLQENGARESARHVPVVWVDAMPKPAPNEPETTPAEPTESPTP